LKDFQPIFQNIELNAQVMGHTLFSFVEILQDKNSHLERARKVYFLKFKYIELAMDGDFHFEIFGKVYLIT